MVYIFLMHSYYCVRYLIRFLDWLIGDPDALVKVAELNESTLEGWADNSHLQLLNLTYDLQRETL